MCPGPSQRLVLLSFLYFNTHSLICHLGMEDKRWQVRVHFAQWLTLAIKNSSDSSTWSKNSLRSDALFALEKAVGDANELVRAAAKVALGEFRKHFGSSSQKVAVAKNVTSRSSGQLQKRSRRKRRR